MALLHYLQELLNLEVAAEEEEKPDEDLFGFEIRVIWVELVREKV
jgi:hypothetical protein